MMDRPKWSMIHQDVAIASQIFLFSRAFISMILTIDNQHVCERQTWPSNWSCKMRWLWVIGTAQSKVMTKSYFGPNQQFFFALRLGSLSTLTIHRKFNACMYMRCWHNLPYHLPDWQFELADMTAQPPHHRILLTMQWDEATQLQLIFIWVNYKRCIFFFPALIGFNKVK